MKRSWPRLKTRFRPRPLSGSEQRLIPARAQSESVHASMRSLAVTSMPVDTVLVVPEDDNRLAGIVEPGIDLPRGQSSRTSQAPPTRRSWRGSSPPNAEGEDLRAVGWRAVRSRGVREVERENAAYEDGQDEHGLHHEDDLPEGLPRG